MLRSKAVSIPTNTATMAASSLDDSIQITSKVGEVSLARQRRKRTTRKSGTRSLNHTELQDGNKKSLSLTQSLSESLTASTQPTAAAINSTINDSLTTTTGTARQRRSQRKRESLHNRVTATVEQTVTTPQHELEDSTAGVANLLERNLDQTDGGEVTGERQEPEDEVIINHSTESPNHHMSEEHQEEGPNPAGSGTLINGETTTCTINYCIARNFCGLA